ncbi:cytochrome bd oxidase small subunit CydS [Neobacillus rhizosphaerae]
MDDFLMFYAPFLVLLASIAVAFWIAPKDKAVNTTNSSQNK